MRRTSMCDLDLVQGYDAAVRDDFTAFVVLCFAELHGGSQPQFSRHIEVMASRLVDVQNGRIRRLIINVPPRHLKSLIVSVAFAAWVLGHDPSAKIMAISYAQPLADKLARDTRAIMTSSWYQRLFPDTQLVSHALEELITTAGGYRLATSVGGAVTGRGANIIILDDPLKADEAMSDTQRDNVNSWYDSTLVSRLNDQQHGAIVIVMQRLHEDDLVGHVLEQGHWDHLCFPAIAEDDEEHHYTTP